MPADLVAPDAHQAIADARMIVAKNRAVDREIAPLSAQGLLFSPVWEIGSGIARGRLAVLPPVFRTRYFESEGAEVLDDDATIELVCDVLPWLVDDPVGAAFALENTLRAWLDDTAPTRSLEIPYVGHYRLLSLLLADIARKSAAGLDELEWLASIGLPVEEFRDDADLPAEAIIEGMKQRLDQMWQDERAWLVDAFGR